MKHSERFKLAARRIERRLDNYSCLAIAGTYPEWTARLSSIWADTLPAVRWYLDDFVEMDEMKLQCAIEAGTWRSHRRLRVLLLYMAATVAEEEGL